MIRKLIKWSHYPPLTLKTTYSQSSLQKILFIIKRILNKMSNEDNRLYEQKFSEQDNKNTPMTTQQKPKTALQAQKLFLKNQQEISAYEKSRLSRIDDILGTKTYFHETKLYQQRVGYDNVLQISQLKQKHLGPSRNQVDFLNPQLNYERAYKKTKKYLLNSKKLKTYPNGNVELSIFQQKPDNHIQNQSLINFLTQQTLYTRLALSQLKLTIESIMKQKLLLQKDGILIDKQLQQNQFYHKGQVYFKPQQSMSIYRIDMNKYNKSMVNQFTYLVSTLQKNIGNIEQVISLDQIYQCLKDFYYDERVNQYLRKIQNSELNYFFSNLQISPDGKDIIVIIDLLDSKKQFVGLFKRIGKSGLQMNGILKQNVIFNIREQVSLRNNGQLYYVQRSQQGLFTELAKTKFNTTIIRQTKDVKDYQNNQNKQRKQLQKRQRNDKILYKCKPFEQLKILTNKQAQVTTSNKNHVSKNIIIQQSQIGTLNNNRLYLIIPENNENKQQINMQLITKNNSNLNNLFEKQKVKQRFGYIDKWQNDAKNLYSQCFQILQVGYLIVRYCFVQQDSGSYLKYGNNKRYAKYVSLIPYKGYSKGIGKQQNIQRLQQTTNITQINKSSSQIQTQPPKSAPFLDPVQTNIQQFQLKLPSQQSSILFQPGTENINFYQLNPQKQQIIFVSPQNHYITNIQIKHTSLSNIYILINHSIQSIYNRNSLYVHSLRKGILPYSVYLDGYPIQIINKNIGSGQPNKINLKLHTPLLSVDLQYTLWKKQIKQILNNRLYTQTITIKQREQCDITIRILSSNKYIKRNTKQKHQSQAVILYLPSKDQKMDQIAVQKIIQKGIILVQITNCRGIFGSNMIQFLRGSKQLYYNYIEDIYQTIVFIKQRIGQRIGIYAEGPSSCFATLLLNIKENQQNQLFDCSVLHQGVYDLGKIDKHAEYFFGTDPTIFKDINPINFSMYNPTKSSKKDEDNNEGKEQTQMITNLSNILFSSLDNQHRGQSRKFINKLRTHNKIIYQTVFLKQFDDKQQKDFFNLAYLYQIMNKKLQEEYVEATKLKRQKIKEQGETTSRKYQDQQFKQRKKQNIQQDE